MKTIPNHVDPSWPRGTHQAKCDYCGAAFMRHQLRRNESGFLACPDDQQGRDEVQLNRMNAESGAQVYKSPHKHEGGANPNEYNLPVIHRTIAADILRVTS